ncbi:MAG: hypothetical protein F2681_05245 [Actinobacteria bacterium]|uniref:Unannotated protein n=1 Tax=freshwater metagenome TaxID=449393 RepID=A0A6J7PLC7_9ZZZZ|nr:hypothetical protein [Actinomycetota bacterium]MSW77546.1 hypothetical protein [Actinomycetota bacterium]MSX56927.1 hypothetical protein [Actinomycetota bacterium]MSX93014.1 hypothetical protein [Actinomycetota bacterium]MSZ82530.1 hypothetical protein [Actinomycetota bacterium]
MLPTTDQSTDGHRSQRHRRRMVGWSIVAVIVVIAVAILIAFATGTIGRSGMV